MNKTIYLIIFLLSVSIVSAVEISDTMFTANDTGTVLEINTTVTLDSVEWNNESIIMTNVYLDSCLLQDSVLIQFRNYNYESYSFTANATYTFVSCAGYSLSSETVEKLEENAGSTFGIIMAAIMVMGIAMVIGAIMSGETVLQVISVVFLVVATTIAMVGLRLYMWLSAILGG